MPESIKYQRLLDKDKIPINKDIKQVISDKRLPLWEDLRKFLKDGYDFEPELTYYGKKYG